MFGLSGGITTYMAIGIIVLTVIFGAYFKYSQVQLEKKQTEIISLKTTVATQSAALIQMDADVIKIKETNTKLMNIERANTERSNKLSATLQKLEKTAAAKPEIVEGLINRAAKERHRCMAIATGSSILKNENNSVCPQFIKGIK